MSNKKETLVIIYRSLLVGGIENYVTNIMHNALKSNKRVIWICNKDMLYSSLYQNIIEETQIEVKRINYSGLNIYKLPNMSFAKDENIKIMVFDIFRLFQAYKIKNRYKTNNIDILYCVPHFTGSSIFPHQVFKGKCTKKIVKKLFARIYNNIYKQGNLYFFSSKHYHAIQDNYEIHFISPNNYLVPELENREKYDEASFRKVYNSRNFTIISPGRFEFPHKGYLIGLIKIYGELKPLYPQLKLLIIGDGPDKDKVEMVIEELPKAYSKDIDILSPQSLEDLKCKMKTVNLNISVAGCASLGARMGLITLPARHYVYDCEVYGFFPNSRNLTTETKPGEPAKQYIEQVINMDEEEYIHYSKLAYHTFDDELYNVNFPFVEHHISNYIPSKWDFCFVKWTYNILRLKYLIARLKK